MSGCTGVDGKVPPFGAGTLSTELVFVCDEGVVLT